jgi:hypothetical protein
MGAKPVGGIIGDLLANTANEVFLVDVNWGYMHPIRGYGLKVDAPV